ncbi:hypothetical protein Tco_1303151 [Tanacetum coccineum]
MLSLSDSTFSGGGDDEGSVAANSVMPALADGDRGVPQKGRPKLGTPPPPSFSTLSSSLSSSDDSLS